jgi:hypothetical protein
MTPPMDNLPNCNAATIEKLGIDEKKDAALLNELK